MRARAERNDERETRATEEEDRREVGFSFSSLLGCLPLTAGGSDRGEGRIWTVRPQSNG